MKITGQLESVDMDSITAIVVVTANGQRHYCHAEARMIANAFDDLWPAGDWQGQWVECVIDHIGLLQSFQPMEDRE